MRKKYLTLLAVLLLLLAACGSRTPEPTTPPPATEIPTQMPPTQPSPIETPVSPIETPVSPVERPSADIADVAVERVISELDAAPEDVEVISIEPVEWSDTSLGCPQPGQTYAQVITPGYRVVLDVDGETYEVHTDATGENVVICQPDSVTE
jgi:hypothetical protein